MSVQEQRAHMMNLAAAAAQTAKSEVVLPPLPAKPTLVDLLLNRLHFPRHGMPFGPAPHCIQSATRALRAGLDEETVLACLLHDLGTALARPDHGWWGAQLIEPYVAEKVTWAVRYHQALRFYPDPAVGYEYPEIYHTLFGRDYQPSEYIEQAYRYARNHRWYMVARNVTLNDEYSFDLDAPMNVEPFIDIIGRHFRQPAEGLGYDSSPTAHMWRTIIDPSRPL